MTSFLQLLTDETLLAAVDRAGWRTPTPIQAAAIPLIAAGRDVLGIAMTGSGKTAAYLLPILQKLRSLPAATTRRPGVLILVPTRELAQQVGGVVTDVADQASLRTGIVYGGVGYARQRKTLTTGVEILIATPGRLIDLMDQGHVLLDRVHTLVLDEADRMLDMGFQEAIESVLAKMKSDRQSLFFSATLPPPIRRLASRMLINPAEVFVDAPATTVAGVEQLAMPVRDADRQNLLYALLAGQLPSYEVTSAVVFANSRSLAGRLTRYLTRRELPVAVMHGGMSQTGRDEVLEQLKSGAIRCLIATDVAARGLDFDALSHVINVEVPLSVESYVHRIGRTARAGLKGTSITFVTVGDAEMLGDIERQIGQKLLMDAEHPYAVELPMPGTALRRRRLSAGEAGERGVEQRRQTTSSGKSAVVEYKAGRRRRTLSGKIRSGKAIKQTDDKFVPAWKKRRPKRKKPQ